MNLKNLTCVACGEVDKNVFPYKDILSYFIHKIEWTCRHCKTDSLIEKDPWYMEGEIG